MKICCFQDRLKELMQINNLRQADIVKRTGLDKSTISYYLNGKREPAQDNIFIIAQAFNVDPAWLMGYDVPMQKKPVDEVLNSGIAIELMEIKNNPDLMRIVQFVKALPPEQQKNVADMLQGFADNKRP